MELVAAVEGLVVSLGASPWILLAVALLAVIDGFFPPVPSESLVITVAVLSVTGSGPPLWAVMAAAGLGAFTGDAIAYAVGSRISLDRRFLRGPRSRAALQWARVTLARRGVMVIFSARFIPIGRVAVNLTAGAVRYPRTRFLGIAAVAGLVWAAYATFLGVAAGHVVHDRPLIAVVVGVVCGLVTGVVVDRLLGAAQRRRVRHTASPVDTTLGPRRHASG